MARPAVAVASLPEPLATVGRQLGSGRRFRRRRTQLAALALVAIGLWLVYVFGHALAQLNAARDREAAMGSETTALSRQLEAGQRELALVQTDSFQRLQARAFGLGGPSEVVFSLEAGAPSAPPIPPLGGAAERLDSQAPLEAWLQLLFGD